MVICRTHHKEGRWVETLRARLAADCSEAALGLECAAHSSINECRSSGGALDCAAHSSINECRSGGGALAYGTGSSGMMSS